MAALAVAGDADVIEIRGRPAHGGVAGDAILVGGKVIGILALGGGAVVAALAVAGDARVGKIGGRPGHR